MPAKKLRQSHFALASSKSKLSLINQQSSHIHPAFILQNFESILRMPPLPSTLTPRRRAPPKSKFLSAIFLFFRKPSVGLFWVFGTIFAAGVCQATFAYQLQDDFESGRLGENWLQNPFSYLSPRSANFAVFDGALHFSAQSASEGKPVDAVLISSKTVTLDVSWEISVVFSLNDFAPPASAGINRKYGICLGVANLSNHFEAVDVGLRWHRLGNGLAVREVYSNFDTKETRTPGFSAILDFGENPGWKEVTAIIRFDPAVGVIQTYVDIGYGVIQLGSFNPFATWGVSASQRLAVGLRGFSNRIDISSLNLVRADDFLLSKLATSPASSVATIDRAYAVSIETQAGATYQLYTSEDMEFWLPLGDPFVGDGSKYKYFSSFAESSKRFYRFRVTTLQ